MSARKRIRGGEEVVDSRPIQQTQDFIEEPASGQGFDSPSARKRTRAEDDGIIAPKRHTLDTLALPARVLLRNVFFLKMKRPDISQLDSTLLATTGFSLNLGVNELPL
jgi:hypothetical protein